MEAATYMTVEELAELLRVSPNTLRYWRTVGKGPRAAKIGRRLVYRESEVQAWIEAQFGEARPA